MSVCIDRTKYREANWYEFAPDRAAARSQSLRPASGRGSRVRRPAGHVVLAVSPVFGPSFCWHYTNELSRFTTWGIMSQNPHRPDSYGLVMALTIMLAVWLINSRGLLRCADDAFSDLTRSQSPESFDAVDLLLVYTDPATLNSSDDRLVELVRSIQALRPSGIGIVDRVSEDQHQRLFRSDVGRHVVVGATIEDLTTRSDRQQQIPRGYLDLWLHDQPVYRWHRARVIREQKTLESLEAVLVRDHQGMQASIPEGEFGVRYRGPASSLPHVEQSAFSDGSIVRELVEGRIVLIGVAEEDELGLVTPTTYGTHRMSRLELHGNILNTMLQKNAIAYANPLFALALLFAITSISSHLFRQVPPDWVLCSGLTCLLVLTGASYVVTRLWSIQLPLAAMWLTCGLNFLGILRSRFHTLATFFQDWKLLRRTNLKTTRRQSYDEIWSSVAMSAAQLFHPERIVLLELETAATHLHVRELVGCEESDIVEKRRDISRSPFRDVLEQRCPVDIGFRPFLCSHGDDTCQYMVPLVAGPDPQGVMVLEVRRSEIDDWSDFDDRLSEFADEMAAFLGGVRERELERLLSNHTLHRIRFLPERIVSRALFQDEVEHRDYEELLDRAIDCSQVPVAIYDVFGRLLKSNKKMIQYLQDHDVSVADTSCAEMLAALTDRSQENCRALVRRCMIDAKSEEILLPPSGETQAARILFVTPLLSIDSADEGIEYRYISIQLIDSGIFHEIQQWHTGFVESHAGALRARISQLHQCTRQLDDQCQSLAPYLKITEEITDALDQCQAALAAGMGERPENCFATDIDPILSKAIEATTAECELRGVRISAASTATGTHAICNPALLRQVMVSILERLLQDATRHSVISINRHYDGDRVRIRFDIVSLLQAANAEGGDEATASQRVVRDGKAALLVVDPHAQWIHETSRMLQPWDSWLRIECDMNYQLAVELDLACRKAAHHAAASPSLLPREDADA